MSRCGPVSPTVRVPERRRWASRSVAGLGGASGAVTILRSVADGPLVASIARDLQATSSGDEMATAPLYSL